MSRSRFSLVLVVMVAALAASLAHAESTPAASTPAAPTTTAAAKAKPAGMHHASTPKAMPAPKVDLNTATREDLVKLPGIGEAIADKIIAARPFKMKTELVSKGLVNKATYRKVSMLVVAHQAK